MENRTTKTKKTLITENHVNNIKYIAGFDISFVGD